MNEVDPTTVDAVDAAPPVRPTLRTSLFGALRKVQSKLHEFENDAEEEQRLDQEFERQWLQEFDRLRLEYAAKWGTCTHAADAFCGLVFHASDAQQQAYLLREYPTLMAAWRDARPDWPPARIAADAAVAYDPQSDREPTQRVKTAPALADVLSVLRTEYQWSSSAASALTQRLEGDGIFSCAELLVLLEKRRGAYAERALQSRAYPRLSKSMLKALRYAAETLERQHESVRELSMEPLHVNPQ